MTSGASLKVFENSEKLHNAAAEAVRDLIGRSLRDRGACFLALSGGETPRPVYRLLGSPPFRDEIDWLRVHLLFGDERMVPPEDPASNYRMVSHELIARVPIPPQNVHRIAGEKEPGQAAREYEAVVESLLNREGGKLDLVLLGLGGDGHTASIFPSSPAAKADRKIQAVHAREIGAWRVTMTLPLINSARRVIFIVAGKGKAGILRRVLNQKDPSPLLPASLIRPAGGECLWMVDRYAASSLS